MTTESHCRGSQKSHSRTKKKEIQEEWNRELLELARDIFFFEKQLQSPEEENQRYGWVMKRKVRWHSLQVKLQQKVFVGLQKEIKRAEFEMEVYYCEPKQGPLLEEDDKQKLKMVF